MCGFAGIYADGVAETHLRHMGDAISHRGPDDSGIWIDAEAAVGFVHRRLSIVDLSPAGHQPMVSTCGRYVLAFNGEIYNHADLRKRLDIANWRGHSDTETLLEAIRSLGIDATLKLCIGMFALALWDRETRTLTLARDRLGEKPLYYGWQNNVFLFGSELKSLKEHPAFKADIDRDSLALFLRHNAIPAPYSIYQGINKLPPGTYLQIHARQKQPSPTTYWSAREVAEAGQRNMFSGSCTDAVNELERILGSAIGGQMIADVPLGAFLSGGIDSTSVVALMQAQSPRPVKTFTIGFNEHGYNEAEHAHTVARHLGTEHTELYVTPEDAMAVIPRLPSLYDEPFADSSQIPTFLVSSLARRHVTVSLSGDGGDELFGGYNRYFWARNIWRKIGWMPRPARAAIAGVLTSFSPTTWNTLFSRLEHWLPTRLRYGAPGDKLHKLSEILAVRSPEEIYLALVSHWSHPNDLVLGGNEPLTVLTDTTHRVDLPDFEHRMMYLDSISYLPDDILAKVDRAAMAVSLETRVPLLDHRVVEFAWALPLHMKIRHGESKWLLRQVLYRHVPRALLERPKMGFGVPIDQWLRGPLKTWAEELLEPARLVREGYLNPAPIQRKWQEHLSGGRNWSYHLWDVLMFQSWLTSNK